MPTYAPGTRRVIVPGRSHRLYVGGPAPRPGPNPALGPGSPGSSGPPASPSPQPGPSPAAPGAPGLPSLPSLPAIPNPLDAVGQAFVGFQQATAAIVANFEAGAEVALGVTVLAVGLVLLVGGEGPVMRGARGALRLAL